MNADRIMVIMGGELVEEGSHEELIRANGKYAELWSKQVFVKAKDGDASDKTGDRAEDIVNDLNSDVAELELAKAKDRSDGSEGMDANDEGDSSGSEDSEDSTDTLVTPGHKKEV